VRTGGGIENKNSNIVDDPNVIYLHHSSFCLKFIVSLSSSIYMGFDRII
jgi:hypothetical protein